jgi:hypothetical protein
VDRALGMGAGERAWWAAPHDRRHGADMSANFLCRHNTDMASEAESVLNIHADMVCRNRRHGADMLACLSFGGKKSPTRPTLPAKPSSLCPYWCENYGFLDDYRKWPDDPSVQQQHFASRFWSQQLGMKQTGHCGSVSNILKNVRPMVVRLRVRHQFDRRNGYDQKIPLHGIEHYQNAALVLAQ